MERDSDTPLHSELVPKPQDPEQALGGYLELVYSPGDVPAGTTFGLRPNHPLIFGRHSVTPDVIGLGDPRLSRRHFEFVFKDHRGLLTDLGSTNGTRVFGERVPPEKSFPCQGGEVIRASDTIFVYRPGRPSPPEGSSKLLGHSPLMAQLRHRVMEIAKSSYPVLILGETGTGKEYLAEEIHRIGGWPEGKFLPVNCAELNRGLSRAELFGTEKGAFTDAKEDRPGLIEAVGNGILFLDEIGELPLDVQAELLRFLQKREYRRVGGNKIISSDARVVAATNVDLDNAVSGGTFRRDLLARLREFHRPLELPPLRHRPEDILQWVRLFNDGQWPAWLTRAAQVERLLCAPWPDNLRGLRQVVREGLPPEPPLVKEAPTPPITRRTQVSEQELRQALALTQGNIKSAAESLNMERTRFYRECKRLGIDPEDYRHPSAT